MKSLIKIYLLIMCLLEFSLSAVISNIGPITAEYIKNFLPNNPIVVEAGAYDGKDTAKMAKLWPTGKIYAFEPVPKLFEKLKQTTKDYNNVFCYEIALGNKNGLADFHVSEVGDASSSLLNPKDHLQIFSFVQFNQVIKVQVKTLDEWARENKIFKIDFLWLDMQGFEAYMLMASPNILKTVKVIYTEVSTRELYDKTILYPEFTKWLASQGFVLVREEVNPHFGGDALFVRSRSENKVE